MSGIKAENYVSVPASVRQTSTRNRVSAAVGEFGRLAAGQIDARIWMGSELCVFVGEPESELGRQQYCTCPLPMMNGWAILSANTCAIVAANTEFGALIRLIILLCWSSDWDSEPRARSPARIRTHLTLVSVHSNAALVLAPSVIVFSRCGRFANANKPSS